MAQEPSYKEMLDAIDDLGRTVEAFKEANDEALEKKANSEAFSEIEVRVERLNESLGKADERKRRLDTELETHRARIEELEALMATGGTVGNKKVLQEHCDSFFKFLNAGGRGGSLDKLLDVERKYRSMLPEQKQVNLASAAAGEALVPEIISSQIETMEMKMSPVRQLIQVIPVASTDFKQVVDTRGTASGWVAETGTRSVTASPTLRVRTPTWGELYARPQATEWAAMDIPNAEAWLARSVAEEFVRAEGVAVISGDGSNKPTGFLNTTPVSTADDDSPQRAAGALQYVDPPSPDDLTEQLLMLIYTLQSGYRPGAQFALNSNSLSKVRRAKTAQGDYLWQPSFQAGQPSSIAGYGFVVWEDMGDFNNTVASPNVFSFPIAFGNWSRGYLMAERSGIRLLVDPYTTIGLISWWFRRREGGIILNNDAIKVARRHNG
jgi:HK97 family phage major capsid protein